MAITDGGACNELQIVCRYLVFNTNGDKSYEKKLAYEMNLERRQLNAFQRIQIVYALEPIEAELAKQRQLAGLKHQTSPTLPSSSSSSSSSPSVQNYTDQEKGRIRDILAKKADVSPSLYVMASQILESGWRDLIDRLSSGEISINKAFQILKEATESRQKYEERRAAAQVIDISEPAKGYQLFYGDVNNKGDKVSEKSIELVYSTRIFGDLTAYSGIGRFASRALNEGGCLIVTAFNFDISRVIEAIDLCGLKYNQRYPHGIRQGRV